MEVVEDATDHYIYNDPFAFLGQHAVGGFFEINKKKGTMKKHTLSDKKMQEHQAKRALKELDEALQVEETEMRRLQAFGKNHAFTPQKFLTLKRMQERRLGVAEQALNYNRRLLGDEKYLTDAGVQRQLAKDPWLRRERRRLRAGRRRVLREMTEERRRLEKDKQAGDLKMERYKSRRRLEMEEFETAEQETIARSLLSSGGQKDNMQTPPTRTWTNPKSPTSDWGGHPENEDDDPLQEEGTTSLYPSLFNHQKNQEDDAPRRLSNHTTGATTAPTTGNGTAPAGGGTGTTAGPTTVGATIAPAGTAVPVPPQPGIEFHTINPSGLAFPIKGEMAGWSFVGPWGTDYIPYGDFLGSGMEYVIYSTKAGRRGFG